MSLDQLQPWLVPWAKWLYRYAAAYGCQITSVRRSYSEQRRLYADYLAGRSKYPAAPPGRSMHEAGRAWDMVGRPEILAWLGAGWESVGGTWGGRFGDQIHFEA